MSLPSVGSGAHGSPGVGYQASVEGRGVYEIAQAFRSSAACLVFGFCPPPPPAGRGARAATPGGPPARGGGLPKTGRAPATSLDTGEVRETTTSGEGSYTLPELKAGRYKITAEAQGFKAATVDEYKVAVQVTHSLDFKLEVGAVTDVVTVTGDQAAAIQTDTSVRQTNVTERQVKELPLEVSSEFSGRTPLSFVFLDSNVTAATGNGTNASNFRVNGGEGPRPRSL